MQFTSPLAFTVTSVPSSPGYVLVIEDAYLTGRTSETQLFTTAAGRPTLTYLSTSANALDVRVGLSGGSVVNTDLLVNFGSLSPASPPLSSTLTIGTGTATTSTAMSTQLPNNLGLRNVYLMDFGSGQQRTDVLQTTISVVPEPTTWALALAGLAASGCVFRRRRQQSRGRSLMAGVAVTLAALLLAAGPADAGVVLSNISQTYATGYGFSSPVQVGLGFNTGSSAGQIDGLSLSLVKGNNINATNSITFSVVLYPAGSTGVPSGSPVSQDNGVTAAWTNPVAGQLQQETFTYSGASLPNLFAATLQANTKYVLAVANDSGTPVFEHYWGVASSGGYTVSDGYSFTTMSRTTDGTSWSTQPFLPIAEMSVTPVPEPASLGLAATGGLAALAWTMLRRRSH